MFVQHHYNKISGDGNVANSAKRVASDDNVGLAFIESIDIAIVVYTRNIRIRREPYLWNAYVRRCDSCIQLKRLLKLDGGICLVKA